MYYLTTRSQHYKDFLNSKPWSFNVKWMKNRKPQSYKSLFGKSLQKSDFLTSLEVQEDNETVHTLTDFSDISFVSSPSSLRSSTSIPPTPPPKLVVEMDKSHHVTQHTRVHSKLHHSTSLGFAEFLQSIYPTDKTVAENVSLDNWHELRRLGLVEGELTRTVSMSSLISKLQTTTKRVHSRVQKKVHEGLAKLQ
ncbi:hypothetical protein G9P44_002360 [Scheffersomyces stipitis]|nr:hypothetical protein G9P44_002360 [Scheffersomyces stipitis]